MAGEDAGHISISAMMSLDTVYLGGPLALSVDEFLEVAEQIRKTRDEYSGVVFESPN